MKPFELLIKNVVLISILLPLICGCSKRDLEGYDRVVGTATINGQSYIESIRWAWNFNGIYPSDISLYKNHKLFHYLIRLSPEKGDNPMHEIHFYISESNPQIKLNHPYKIDFYRALDVEPLYWGYVIPYFSKNKSKVLAEGADGIAYVLTSDSDETIPLKGEFRIEKKSPDRNIYFGSYTLFSSKNNSGTIVIHGKFETSYYISDYIYN